MRAQSRVIAFKAIFSSLFDSDIKASLNEIFEEEKPENKQDEDFAKLLVDNFVEHKTELDEFLISNVQNYEIDRIYKVDLALIYLGLTEIFYVSTPIPVVVNEILEIAKKYSTEKSQKFINGVLAKSGK